MTPATLQSTLQRLGLSQAEAARLLGVTPGAVTRWMAGQRAVPEPIARLLWAWEQAPKLMDQLRQIAKNPASPPNNR